MGYKVILDPHGRRLEQIFSRKDMERLQSFADLVWARNEPMPEAEIEACREDVIAIVTGGWRHGDVSQFPKLRAVLEVSGSFPSPIALDYDECFSRKIRVLSCAPAFGPAVAEMALVMAISAARRLVWNHEDFREGRANWSHHETGGTFTLYDKSVGFIGFGGLARSLKPLLEPFRCPIQVFDPWMTDSYLRTFGVNPVDLETLLSTSRFVFVLAVPTRSNRALLDRERLELLSPDSVLLLMSRSHLVDFDALTEMVLEGRLRLGVDVFPEEPLPADHPIRRAPNVILSSHRAGAIDEAFKNIGRIVVNDMEAISRGLEPREMQLAQPEFIKKRG
jgi:phosphoglycerate dehydrogenase-like enzyme